MSICELSLCNDQVYYEIHSGLAGRRAVQVIAVALAEVLMTDIILCPVMLISMHTIVSLLFLLCKDSNNVPSGSTVLTSNPSPIYEPLCLLLCLSVAQVPVEHIYSAFYLAN